MAKLKNQTQAPEPEGIDFEAAMPSQQNDDDLKVAMRTLRSGRPIPTSYPMVEGPLKRPGQSKGSKATKKPKVNSSNPQANPPGSPHGGGDHIYNNINNINKSIDSKSNINCSDLLSKQIDIDIKAEFTEKELKFLKIYLLGDVTQEMAMIFAGYKSTQPRYIRFLAKKIIQKYESMGGDHQKIFREIGFGEVEIAMGIKNLAQNAKSEMVKLNALALAAKCLGLTKEQVERAGAITIVFETPDKPRQPSHALPVPQAAQAGEAQPVLTYQGTPGRVLQITK